MGVQHFTVNGVTGCGRNDHGITGTSDLDRVRCKTCLSSVAYRRAVEEAAKPAAALSVTAYSARKAWADRLAALPGASRTPRGDQQRWL